MARDYNAMIDCGGNIYSCRTFSTRTRRASSSRPDRCTGMTQEEYAEMMLKGALARKGKRSKKGG